MKGKLFSLAIFVMVLALAFIGCSTGGGSDPASENWSVTAAYPVDTAAALYTSTLTVTSAQESDWGNVSIVLGGTIPLDKTYKTSASGDWKNTWSDPADLTEGFSPAAGNYGSFCFVGAFPDNPDGLNIAIKQTNDALRYNTGWTSRVSTTELTAPAISDLKSMYLGETAYRWRTYGTTVPDTEDLSVLLWSGAANKTITLEIQSVADDGITTTLLKTITIDYSAVKFETNVTSTNPYPKTTASEALSPANLTVDSAIRNDVTGVVTLTLEGNITPEDRYDFSGSGSPEAASADWKATWSDPADAIEGFTPAAGKYGSFFFDGAFSIGSTSLDKAIRQTNDALRYHTGWTSRVSTTPLTVPVVKADEKSMYLGETAYRWRTYGTGIATSENLCVLLWSAAPNKTIALEVQSITDSNDPAVEGTDYDVLNKIVIDYSAVTFND